MEKLFATHPDYVTHYQAAATNAAKQVHLKKAGTGGAQSTLSRLRGDGDPSALGAMEGVQQEESEFDKSHRLQLAKLKKYVGDWPWTGTSSGARDKDKCAERMLNLTDTGQMLLILRLAMTQQESGETAEAKAKFEALELLLEQGEHLNLWACVAMKVKDHLSSIFAAPQQILSAVEHYERRHLRKDRANGPIARVQLSQWRSIADVVATELKRENAKLKTVSSASSTPSSAPSAKAGTSTAIKASTSTAAKSSNANE